MCHHLSETLTEVSVDAKLDKLRLACEHALKRKGPVSKSNRHDQLLLMIVMLSLSLAAAQASRILSRRFDLRSKFQQVCHTLGISCRRGSYCG